MEFDEGRTERSRCVRSVTSIKVVPPRGGACRISQERFRREQRVLRLELVDTH